MVSYIDRWTDNTETGVEEIACAMVLVDRLCATGRVTLCAETLHRLLLGALLCASKWREDHPFKMSAYACVGGIQTADLLELEARVLNDLMFDVHINAATFSEYLGMLHDHAEWQEACDMTQEFEFETLSPAGSQDMGAWVPTPTPEQTLQACEDLVKQCQSQHHMVVKQQRQPELPPARAGRADSSSSSLNSQLGGSAARAARRVSDPCSRIQSLIRKLRSTGAARG